jgi:uncharacterized membrane protein YphA (DoxX/SURF4 family)
MADDSSGSGLTLGRLLFGLGVALRASEGGPDLVDLIEYAESAGVPAPDLLAPLASGMMLVGGLGTAFWKAPRISTGAVTTFLAVVTLTMHDFWNADPDDRDGERLAFFGNLAMFGGALAFLRKAYSGD